MPVLGERGVRMSRTACRPPADAPNATIGKGRIGVCRATSSGNQYEIVLQLRIGVLIVKRVGREARLRGGSLVLGNGRSEGEVQIVVRVRHSHILALISSRVVGRQRRLPQDASQNTEKPP